VGKRVANAFHWANSTIFAGAANELKTRRSGIEFEALNNLKGSKNCVAVTTLLFISTT